MSGPACVMLATSRGSPTVVSNVVSNSNDKLKATATVAPAVAAEEPAVAAMAAEEPAVAAVAAEEAVDKAVDVAVDEAGAAPGEFKHWPARLQPCSKSKQNRVSMPELELVPITKPLLQLEQQRVQELPQVPALLPQLPMVFGLVQVLDAIKPVPEAGSARCPCYRPVLDSE